MKIVKTGPYTSKCVYSWWDCVKMWLFGSIIRWWRLRRLGHNLTKAFQNSVAEAKERHKNIEQINEERGN